MTHGHRTGMSVKPSSNYEDVVRWCQMNNDHRKGMSIKLDHLEKIIQCLEVAIDHGFEGLRAWWMLMDGVFCVDVALGWFGCAWNFECTECIGRMFGTMQSTTICVHGICVHAICLKVALYSFCSDIFLSGQTYTGKNAGQARGKGQWHELKPWHGTLRPRANPMMR